MNPDLLKNAIELTRMGMFNELEMICDAAERTLDLERFEQFDIHPHVWHSGLGKNPWMFEVRRAGILYGSFMDVPAGFPSRHEAEIMAVKVADSMVAGTFQQIYTYLREKCPKCGAKIIHASGICIECEPMGRPTEADELTP